MRLLILLLAAACCANAATITGNLFATPGAEAELDAFALSTTPGVSFSVLHDVLDVNDNSTVGTLYAVCTTLQPTGLAQCTATFVLEDGDSIEIAGILTPRPGATPLNPPLAVVGGTGAYIGATGTWSLVEAEGLNGVQTDIATHTIVVNVTSVASS